MPVTELDAALAALHISEVEAREAEGTGTLDLLVLERVLVPGARRYDIRRLADETGVPVNLLRRLWRACGFPDPGTHERVFTEADVAALRSVGSRLDSDAELERALHQLRVVSSSLSRVAEMRVDDYARRRAELQASGQTQREMVAALLEENEDSLSAMVFMHLYRRQLLAAARRRLTIEEAGPGQTTTVGFVDMVGFTALTEELEVDELGATVSEFELHAYEAVAEHGGRVVKTIGDEVMFTVDSPSAAADIAVRLANGDHRGPLTPQVRAGIALGTVLARDGDCFGSAVNLAARLVNIAYPDTVLASESVYQALADDQRYEWRFLHPRRLKGLGRVPAWVVRRA